MKFKRFISVFLLCTCLTGLFLTPAAGALEVPDIQAKAALLADVNTDAVAYAKNIHEKNYPASLTKIMTCLLALENGRHLLAMAGAAAGFAAIWALHPVQKDPR